MQDSRDAFCKLPYMMEERVRGFYEAQNIAILSDEFTIQEQFLKGLPHEMLIALIIDGGLSPEVNIGIHGQSLGL